MDTLTADELKLLQSTFDAKVRETKGLKLTDSERRDVIKKAIEATLGEQHPWLGQALALMFSLMVDVDKGKLSLKPSVSRCFFCGSKKTPAAN
jgi:hypothetical protein